MSVQAPEPIVAEAGVTSGKKPDLAYVDELILRHGRAPEAVIPILQGLQEHYGYIPGEALLKVCETTSITPASVTGVSSFYDMFRLKPAGKSIVRVCRGTACHVTGAERVEDALRRHLKIARAKTPMRQVCSLSRR